MRELDDGLGRRVDRQHDTVAKWPVIAATVARHGRANERPPKHDGYRVDEQRRGGDGKPVGGAHRETMESVLTDVNDPELEGQIVVATAVENHEV